MVLVRSVAEFAVIFIQHEKPYACFVKCLLYGCGEGLTQHIYMLCPSTANTCGAHMHANQCICTIVAMCSLRWQIVLRTNIRAVDVRIGFTLDT